MKRIIIIMSLLLIAAGIVTAEGINLGSFPLGKWLDPNYDAVWEFTTENIRILSTDGEVYYDFGEKTVRDFKVAVEAGKPVMSFSCDESRRSYKFTKPISNMNIILEIDAPWQSDYMVEMKKQ
ncbi:MAG: hypothetical protein ACP5IA_10850 [Sediminispirochaetaceae bacterium]